MPTGMNMEGPRTSSAVITSASMNGGFGRLNDEMDHCAAKLFDQDEMSLKGEGYESRADKFIKTIQTFTKGGCSTGAGLGVLTMIPVDFVAGRGNARQDGEPGSFFDEGLAGQGIRLGTAIAAGTAEIGGNLVGGILGVVSLPANASGDKTSVEWVERGALHGGQAIGKTVAHAGGTAGGLALDIVRIPSLAVKYTLAGVGAVVGTVVGFFAGSVRAIFNV